MKKKLALFSMLLCAAGIFAQQGDGGQPRSNKLASSYKTIDKHVYSEPDIEALRAEDALVEKNGSGPWRFGFNNATNLTLNNSGTWSTLPNGDRIWQVVLECTNALTVNLTLDQVSLPEGNELYVYNPDKSFILGKFTSYHLYEGNLGTELVPGNTAVVEYYVPARNPISAASLRIHTVTHGYRTAGEFVEKAFGSSGNCNMNVNCADGASWVNQRNGALMLVSGSNGFCSGSLINNTQNDGKPYVLTANHCYSNPATWIFRFNWQAAGCSNPGASPTFQSLSGAVLRSRRTPSDFCLVEITGGLVNNTVPAICTPYFSGWDNSGTVPTSAVSIHHPSGDIKKISFDDNSLVISQGMGSTEANSTWTVQWDRNTTTEGGSSGSPIFDQNHRIIGQLWGGGASCSNLSSPDYYGRVANSWAPAGSNSTNQLKFWLDPNSTGVTFIDGYDPAGPAAALDAGINSVAGVSGVICSGTVTPSVTIANSGTSALTSATINYGFDGATNLTYNWTGNLAQYQTNTVTLPSATLSSGNHTFKAIVTNPNAATDENHLNDTILSSFNTNTTGETITLSLTMDCYGDETTWTLQNNAGTITYYSGGPYAQDNGGTTVTVPMCLTPACFKFTLNDSYGDGMTSSGCPNGYYTITNASGTIVSQLLAANANFGSSINDTFCTSSTAGLGENDLQWTLYPNPAQTDVTVQIDASGEKRIVLTSTTGQIVYQSTTSENQVTIPVSNFAKGLYLVTIQTSAGTAIKQVVLN
jgi:hypothetical protein